MINSVPFLHATGTHGNMTRSQKNTEQGRVPENPKRPLSAYNLYFLAERRRILDGNDQFGLPASDHDLRSIISEHKEKTKRIHRKTHGKIGFLELARTIASRWKNLDGEQRMIYNKIAALEKQEYAENLALWNAFKASQDYLLADRSQTGLSAIFQQDEAWVNNIEVSARRNMQELYHQLEMKMAKRPQSTKDALPSVVSFNEAYGPSGPIRTIGSFQSAIRVRNKESTSISENPIQSSREEKNLDGSDHEMMTLSPIFYEAHLANYDLFEPLDSHAMEQIFLDC